VYVYTPTAETPTVVRNCTFTQNEAPVSAGGLFLNSTAVVDGCIFSENVAVSGVGAAMTAYLNVTLTNSNFSRNFAKEVSSTANSINFSLMKIAPQAVVLCRHKVLQAYNVLVTNTATSPISTCTAITVLCLVRACALTVARPCCIAHHTAV
jgi:hypothetical protein